MSASNFLACLAETEQFEGGYSNDPYDPGGVTFKGVTQRVYTAWRQKQGYFVRTVAHASDEEIATIYREQYWDAVRGDDLFAGLDMTVFDPAVNAGPVRAIKFLQQALGVAVDGHFGLETFGAVQKVNDRAALIQRVCALRMSFWHMISTWWRFGKGWSARGNGVEAKALAMLAGLK